MQGDYQCFCGDNFTSRDLLIDHNVQAHAMSRDESHRRVMEKYPDRTSQA